MGGGWRERECLFSGRLREQLNQLGDWSLVSPHGDMDGCFSDQSIFDRIGGDDLAHRPARSWHKSVFTDNDNVIHLEIVCRHPPFGESL